MQLLEMQYEVMAIGNMHPLLKEKIVAQEYGDLDQLASKAY